MSLDRELTRNRRVEMLEGRVEILAKEVETLRSAVMSAEKFLASWTRLVDARLDRLQLPWWRKAWEMRGKM